MAGYMGWSGPHSIHSSLSITLGPSAKSYQILGKLSFFPFQLKEREKQTFKIFPLIPQGINCTTHSGDHCPQRAI